MITKKKGLYLGLLVSLFGIGNAMQAYTVKIKNSTPHTVKFKVDLMTPAPDCKDRYGELASGDIATKINIGGCSIKGVYATVQRPGRSAIEAKPYKAPPLGRAGSSAFIISGSDETGYTVTRFRR